MIIFTFLNFAEGKRTVIYLWKWLLLHSFLSTKMQIFVYLVNEWPGKKLKDEDDFSAVMLWDSMPTLDSMNSLPAGLLCNGICPAQTNRLIFFLPVAERRGIEEEKGRKRTRTSKSIHAAVIGAVGCGTSNESFLEEHLGSDAFKLCGLE